MICPFALMNKTSSRIENINAIQGVVVHLPNLLSKTTISKTPNKRDQLHIHKQGEKRKRWRTGNMYDMQEIMGDG